MFDVSRGEANTLANNLKDQVKEARASEMATTIEASNVKTKYVKKIISLKEEHALGVFRMKETTLNRISSLKEENSQEIVSLTEKNYDEITVVKIKYKVDMLQLKDKIADVNKRSRENIRKTVEYTNIQK